MAVDILSSLDPINKVAVRERAAGSPPYLIKHKNTGKYILIQNISKE